MTLSHLAEVTAATVAAALAPAAVLALFGWSSSLLTIAFVVAFFHAALLGLPAFLLLRAKRWVNAVTCLGVGFFIGAIPVGIFTWPLLYTQIKTNAWTGTGSDQIQTMLDGVPTATGWFQYSQGVLLFGAFGALGGITFWAILRAAGALPSSLAGPDIGIPLARGASESTWRRLLLGAVPLLAVGVLAVPAITKDRSCHNMLRDGRTSISPVATLDLQIPDDEWPRLVELLGAFAATNEYSLRNDSKVRPDVMRSLYLSVCHEQGVNISIVEQRWAHNHYESVMKGRGVSIGVYVQQAETDWVPVARILVNDLESMWPDKLRFTDGRGRIVAKPENISNRGK